MLRIAWLVGWWILRCPFAIQMNKQTTDQPTKQTNNRDNKEARLRYLPHTVCDDLNASRHIASLFGCSSCHSSATTRSLVEHDHNITEMVS